VSGSTESDGLLAARKAITKLRSSFKTEDQSYAKRRLLETIRDEVSITSDKFIQFVIEIIHAFVMFEQH